MEELKRSRLVESRITESSLMSVAMSIRSDLFKFINDVVIPKSKGYVKNERDAALLLMEILKIWTIR